MIKDILLSIAIAVSWAIAFTAIDYLIIIPRLWGKFLRRPVLRCRCRYIRSHLNSTRLDCSKYIWTNCSVTIGWRNYHGRCDNWLFNRAVSNLLITSYSPKYLRKSGRGWVWNPAAENILEKDIQKMPYRFRQQSFYLWHTSGQGGSVLSGLSRTR